jgi:ADP-ribosylglycohydrolase
LGDDANTTTAISGQIAGAYYGMSGIPKDLINGLAKSELIANFAKKISGHHITK